MKVLSIYAPIPPTQYRTVAGDKLAAHSWDAIRTCENMGCELILHNHDGQAYFSIPEGFAHPAVIEVCEDWRIATYLYQKTGVQYTKFRIETTRNKSRVSGVRVITYPELETKVLCINNISIGPIEGQSRQSRLNTADLTDFKGSKVFDKNNELLITL